MTVVDRIRVPELRVPVIMPSARGVASELAKKVSKDKIYVAVGKDVKESKSKLVWTVRQSEGNFKVCIIHVLVPSQRIPMEGLGVGLPASSVNKKVLREHRENERKNMHELLENYLLVCRQMGVQAEKECIESDSFEKGIVELIRLHGIKKLVMGNGTDKRYFKCQFGRRMTEINSKKAIFVHDKAPLSCHIWFIHEGQLIHTREALTVQAVAEVPTNVPLPTTPTPEAGQLILSNSQSAALQRTGATKLSNPFEDALREFSLDTDQCAVIPIASPSSDSSLVHPNAGGILERQDSFQELEPVSTGPSHCLQFIQSVYHTSQSSLSSTLENDAQEVLESPFVETDQSRKKLEQKVISMKEKLRTYKQERELMRIDFDNALQKAEEVSRRQRDSSGTKYFYEFSMTEIKEAVRNFDPSLKIGEGASGIVYRGFLRHTPVAIKTMKFHSMQDSKQFQQEVDVLSKVRHRHLITLIGACPEPWTLVYEYVPNGSLEDWLFNSNRAKQLSWQARICIATELCTVLAYLHSCKPHSIVHGDVKPGNILLDAHLVCKLGDFGISRMLSRGQRSSNNTTIVQTDPKGTLGYMDPEFVLTRELTTKCDVYSFGIILLQLLTRKPTLGITKDVQRAISDNTLEAILDPLAGEWPYTLAEELTRLALRCCKMSRSNRPDLQSDVMAVLESVGASYL
ncbi:hypothetical protein BT93_J0896 [Corymbia citriodora subsp. variegata]|nr:hypothetical protein BT93_J0896 [Corymbia citriodora subsp. variegata]